METRDIAAPAGQERAQRVSVIDALRGIASFAVCWFHLVYADHAFAGGGVVAAALRDSAMNAWVGVEVFFVISGFVIPLALYRARYTANAYGSFILKRLVRLDPPYLVSVAMCLVLWFLWATIPQMHGSPFDPSPLPVLLHIGYLNAFFGYAWLNPVYWTLAIEFQYYLGMGIAIAALASRSVALRYSGLACLGALAVLIPEPNLVFHYLFVFMLGIVTFQYFVGLLSLAWYLPTMLVVVAGCAFTLGPIVAAISLLTALAIAFVRRNIPLLGFLGTISYSLYLVHVPVGGRILGLGLSHVHGGAARVAVLALTVALTLLAAWLFYLAVERPAQRWSSGVRYGTRLSLIRRRFSAVAD